MSFAARMRHRLRLIRHPQSIGVRVLVEDDARAVLLVRHTYTPGWHFPGGGVDAHETAVEAAIREVREETAVEIGPQPELLGVFLNRKLNGRDHVLLFRSQALRLGQFRPNLEIAEARFFARHELPDDLSAATQRRLGELGQGAAPAPEW